MITEVEPVLETHVEEPEGGLRWGRIAILGLGLAGLGAASYHTAGAFENSGDNGDRADAIAYDKCLDFVEDNIGEGETRLVVSFPGVSGTVLADCGISFPASFSESEPDDFEDGFSTSLDAEVSDVLVTTSQEADIVLPTERSLTEAVEENVSDANDFNRTLPIIAAPMGAVTGLFVFAAGLAVAAESAERRKRQTADLAEAA